MVNKDMLALGETRSVIRELFEYGKQLAAERGEENVFDFSLGNPCAPVPDFVNDAVAELTAMPNIHNYSSAQGDISVRKHIAEYSNEKWNLYLTEDNIYLTAGAAAGLTITFRALNADSDQFIIIAPYFPEYPVFIRSCGGNPIAVNTKSDFSLDVSAIEKAINKKTKAIIINSPNNPAGNIYPKEQIIELAEMLKRKQKELDSSIYLISDEPYRELSYNTEVPCPMSYYENTITCYSFSKSLSLAGERIGYIAVSPKADNSSQLYSAICGAGRALGYVCAPSMFQQVIMRCLGRTADLEIYRKNRDLIYSILCDLGLQCVKPEGAFYLFAKCPCNPKKFFEACKEEGLLVVPSDSFGIKGYVRIAYCVPTERIINSAPKFKAVAKKCGLIE